MNIKSLKLYKINGNVFIASESIEKAIELYELHNSALEYAPEITSIERVPLNETFYVNVLVDTN